MFIFTKKKLKKTYAEIEEKYQWSVSRLNYYSSRLQDELTEADRKMTNDMYNYFLGMSSAYLVTKGKLDELIHST